MNRILFAMAMTLLTAATGLAQQGEDPASDALLRAMSDELKRSSERLAIADAERPYFISYLSTETESFSVAATFGALIESDQDHRRELVARVRVGGYEFDNSMIIGERELYGMYSSDNAIVVEPDYYVLRHELWLATDIAYKEAVEQLARKRATTRNRVDAENLPDFSREEPQVSVAERVRLDVDKAGWENRIREWSAIFRRYPQIHESRIGLSVKLQHRCLATSEGTLIRQPQMSVVVTIEATTRTDDGMRLASNVPIFVASLDKLPKSEDISAAIVAVAEELIALRQAPTLDESYSGPVLYAGEAAPQILASLFATSLSGQRPPVFEQEQLAAAIRVRGGEFQGRINRPVLATSLSVYDDPTISRYRGAELLGGYRFDDEGVPARRVALVEQGVLKDLFMTRRPSKDLPASNGHARLSPLGYEAGPSNLIVESAGGLTEDKLKEELIAACRAQNLPFGIVIKRLKSPGSLDIEEILVSMFTPEGQRQSHPAPLIAYRVYLDGREELVRGVTVGDLSVKSLREISAAGSTLFVHNRSSGDASPFASFLSTSGEGATVSIVAPSVLFEELEVKDLGATQTKPLLLTHPFFEK